MVMPLSAHDPTIAPADREFAALLFEAPEFEPGEQGYANFIRFNLSAVDRGEELVSRLRELIPLEQATVVDIGAGSGGISIAFANAGADVWAVEPDERRRRWLDTRVRGRNVPVRVTAAAAEQLPVADSSVDLILMDSVIEHVDDPGAAIAEAARVLKPDGLVYLVSPNKFSLLNVIRDPHYQMAGVVLMPRWLGCWYVERLRHSKRRYWVNVIPTASWLRRCFVRHGVCLQRQAPEGIDKLRRPATIARYPWIRILAHLFKMVEASALLERIAVAQNPSHVFIGVKRASLEVAECGRRMLADGDASAAGSRTELN